MQRPSSSGTLQTPCMCAGEVCSYFQARTWVCQTVWNAKSRMGADSAELPLTFQLATSEVSLPVLPTAAVAGRGCICTAQAGKGPLSRSLP